jgi:hypothetical protein
MTGLNIRQSEYARVEKVTACRWRLWIGAGPAGQYRWAQLDDYINLPREHFYWQAPFCLKIRARISTQDVEGTWGFGFWNDPFSTNMRLKGTIRHLPTLPQAAWFFYASPPNYLALRDVHPARGMLMASFSSWRLPTPLLFPGLLALPLFLIRPIARLLRRLARLIIADDAGKTDIDLTDWHSYRLDCKKTTVRFYIDDQPCFETPIVPRGKLGLVIWIDNQYLAFEPNGALRAGTLATPEDAWLEVEDIAVNKNC